LALVEDCVHALGATYGGRQVGSFGHAAFFSTEETKIITTTVGGIVVTDDPELAERLLAFQEGWEWPAPALVARYLLKLITYHLLTQPHVHSYARALYEAIGRRQPLPRPTTHDELRGERPAHYEQRLSNAQAALGQRQLRRLGSNLAHRRALAATYAARLSDQGFAVPQWPANTEPSFVRYPVWVEDREQVVRLAAPHAVLGTWFSSVLEEAVSPAHGGYQAGSCPRAEAAARHLVNLPTHPRVGAAAAEAIIATLVSASARP
jgi:dTDP-4-amino-4,6-dideoxygalactose transaminase